MSSSKPASSPVTQYNHQAVAEAYIYQPATVVAVDSNLVTLATIKLATCQQCVMKSGCGHRMLNKTQDCEKSQVKLPHPSDRILQVGNEVTIAVPQHTFLLASLWLFFVPLLMMLVFASLAQVWLVAEIAIAGFGIAGLGVGLLLMRLRIKRLQNTQAWQPFILPSTS